MSVFISNLDDFIAPSQACVNPILNDKKKPERESVNSRIAIQNDFSVTDFDIPAVEPDLIKSKVSSSHNITATVSLNDCLACRYRKKILVYS